MTTYEGPLLTAVVLRRLRAARHAGSSTIACSLDLERTSSPVELTADSWIWRGMPYPYPERCKDRTIYYWAGDGFAPLARYTSSLIKLVPTDWGPPTFEIDGIKMLPSATVSPYADAERKVELIQPRGKVILDTCGGLGYFAAWCLRGHAHRIASYEKNADVLWLRRLNPWSPPEGAPLTLTHADIVAVMASVGSNSIDAVLHDPPRFGIAGELYSQTFYEQLARVLRRRGRLFHYVGAPNQLTTGRDVPSEIANRLKIAGFRVEKNGDGILAVKK